MSHVKDVELIPDPARTIEGLRDTGYTFQTAVADLVDNSIAASATRVDIQVMLDVRGNVRLTIADDGCGMNREELQRAMTYGAPKRRDPASLGKFGLGLKTASTAFCRRLSVVSRGSERVLPTMATWDLDHVGSTNQWLLQESDEPDEGLVRRLNEVAGVGSGTVVGWDKVDRLLRAYKNPGGGPQKRALTKKCGQLAEHLSMTFQRFLDQDDDRAQNLTIVLNGRRLEPWDPFQTDFSDIVADETVAVIVDENGTETTAEFLLRAFILPRAADFSSEEKAKAAKISSNRQGLYIYREQRLIHAGGWLRMFAVEPHLSLIRVEFSFDHRLDQAFHLDVKKSQIVLRDELIKELKDTLLPAPRREANRRYRYGVSKKIRKKAEDAHDVSNVAIKTKEAAVGGPRVRVVDETTGAVTVSNPYGEHRIRLKITRPSKPGAVFVQPTDDVVDGILFEPGIIEGHKAVRINTQHIYYEKMYVPNLDRSVTVQGLDALLWALCVAELSTTADATEEAIKDMRYEVSRILRKLAESLPDPVLDEGEAS